MIYIDNWYWYVCTKLFLAVESIETLIFLHGYFFQETTLFSNKCAQFLLALLMILVKDIKDPFFDQGSIV